MDSVDRKLARDQVLARLFGAVGEPKTIGRYRLLSRLGAGGMGVVYAAHDPDLDRQVALKIMHPGVADPSRVARMIREAQALARVSHRNVVMVHDAGEYQGRVYLTMELVAGPTLGEWVKADEPAWEAIVDAAVQVCRGLSAAHAAGLVHRDFKPSNAIRTTDGTVKVLDFGLVRPADVVREGVTGELLDKPLEVRLTKTSAVLGTPAYIAPEQLQGEPVDARTDVYSVCASLYELLYGTTPHRGATIADLLRSVLQGEAVPPPPRKGVPKAIPAAILRGLSRSPAARQPSMDALAQELTARTGSRRAWAWIGAGVGLAFAAAAAFGLVVTVLEDDPLPDATPPIAEASVDASAAAPPKPLLPMLPRVADAGGGSASDAMATSPPPEAPTAPTTEPAPVARPDPDELDTGELDTRPFTRSVVRRCWAEYQRDRTVTEAAPVTIDITVAATGAVRSLSADSLAPVPELLSCIESRGRGYRFPRSNRERSEQYGLLLRPE